MTSRKAVCDFDSTPPDTTLVATPANPTNETAPTFGFTSPEAGATFECSLDAAAYEPCTSPKSYSGVAAGLAHLPRAGGRRLRQRGPDSRHVHMDDRRHAAGHDDRFRAAPGQHHQLDERELRVLERGTGALRVPPRPHPVHRLLGPPAAVLRRARRRHSHVPGAGDRPSPQRRPDPRLTDVDGRHDRPVADGHRSDRTNGGFRADVDRDRGQRSRRCGNGDREGLLGRDSAPHSSRERGGRRVVCGEPDARARQLHGGCPAARFCGQLRHELPGCVLGRHRRGGADRDGHLAGNRVEHRRYDACVCGRRRDGAGR